MASAQLDRPVTTSKARAVLSYVEFSLSLGTISTFAAELSGASERASMLCGLAAAATAVFVKRAGLLGARGDR